MIKKPSIIITSGGRTGTVFFYNLFKNILKSCDAFHEPENIDLSEINNLIWKFKYFGFVNTTINKTIGKWGITTISNKRMKQSMSIQKAAQEILKHRRKFIDSLQKEIYVEASYYYYGVIDVLPYVFDSYRVIYIIRDGRDWVRSHMNTKFWYHPHNPHTIFSTRISPKLINDQKYSEKWDKMSRFEKLCWAWSTINSYAIKTISSNKNACLYYFEDIFTSNKKESKLPALVEFATSNKNIRIQDKIECETILEKKINISPKQRFPQWDQWTPELKSKFDKICGPLMRELKYKYNNDTE